MGWLLCTDLLRLLLRVLSDSSPLVALLTIVTFLVVPQQVRIHGGWRSRMSLSLLFEDETLRR